MFQDSYKTAFSEAADPAHYEKAFDTEDQAVEFLWTEYRKASWKHLGAFRAHGTIPVHYQLPKYKDIVADCEKVKAKKGVCCRQRPILPYTDHPLKSVYKRGGKALGAIVRSLPPKQFDIDRVSTVRQAVLRVNKEAREKFGAGGFKWISMLGDLSCMYDELNPQVAVERVASACDKLPEWLDLRKARLPGVNMGWNAKNASMGRPNADHKVFLSFEGLVDLCTLDCNNTLYSLGGSVNRRKFGVPMGGYMSPQLARLYCSTTELEMTRPPGLEEMVGFEARYMDDVFAVYAVRVDQPEDEETVREWFEIIRVSYPDPLYLTVEEESSQARFLELLVDTSGDEIVCRLYNPVVEGPGVPRLPHWMGGESYGEKMSRLVGQIHRVTDGSTHLDSVTQGIVGMASEVLLSGWPLGILLRALQVYGQHSLEEKLWQTEVDDLSRTLLSLLSA